MHDPGACLPMSKIFISLDCWGCTKTPTWRAHFIHIFLALMPSVFVPWTLAMWSAVWTLDRQERSYTRICEVSPFSSLYFESLWCHPPTHPNPTVEWTSYPLSISFCLLNLVSREILWNVFIKCTYFQGQLFLVPLWNVDNEAHFLAASQEHQLHLMLIVEWMLLFPVGYFFLGFYFFSVVMRRKRNWEVLELQSLGGWNQHIPTSIVPTHHDIKSIAITYALSCCSQICFPKLKASHYPVNAILVEIFRSNHKILVNGRLYNPHNLSSSNSSSWYNWA